MIWWLLNNTYFDSFDSSSSPGGGFGGGAASGQGSAPPDIPTGNSTQSAALVVTSKMELEGTQLRVARAARTVGGGVSLGNLGSGTSVSPSIENYASDNSEVCLVFINANSNGDGSELADAEQDALVNTVADVLYGDVNPSVKLTYTIAKNASDYPATVCYRDDSNYTQSVYIDYRWFEKESITLRFPFGHGLSYTIYTYGGVTITNTNYKALSSKYATGPLSLDGQADLWNEVTTITTSIKNSGSIRGAEVAQLYISFPTEAEQPVKVLHGSEKTTAAPGQTAKVTLHVRRRDMSYWATAAQKWAAASGKYTFSVGSSSQDIRGNATLTI